MSRFHRLIEQQIPRLIRYARALTRNDDRADDLVQDTLDRALTKGWHPGTDLRAWLFTILHHQNVNQITRLCARANGPRRRRSDDDLTPRLVMPAADRCTAGITTTSRNVDAPGNRPRCPVLEPAAPPRAAWPCRNPCLLRSNVCARSPTAGR
jgi:hypothetical protein